MIIIAIIFLHADIKKFFCFFFLKFVFNKSCQVLHFMPSTKTTYGLRLSLWTTNIIEHLNISGQSYWYFLLCAYFLFHWFFFCLYLILICFNHFKLFLAYLTFLSLTGTFKQPCLPSTWQSHWLKSHSSLCETYNSDELSNLSSKN